MASCSYPLRLRNLFNTDKFKNKFNIKLIKREDNIRGKDLNDYILGNIPAQAYEFFKKTNILN